MNIEDLNKLIPAELKAKLKTFAQKFNTPPVATPPATPPAPAIPATPALQLQEAPLEDGTVLKYDTPAMAVGSVVTVLGPEGEMPAPTGELKMKDGSVIVVVSKDGKSVIESIKPAETPVMGPPAPQLQAQIQSHMREVQEKFNATQKDNESLKSMFAAQKKELEDAKNTVTETRKDVSEFIQLFMSVLDIPSADPIKEPQNKFAKGVDKRFENLTQFSPKDKK